MGENSSIGSGILVDAANIGIRDTRPGGWPFVASGSVRVVVVMSAPGITLLALSTKAAPRPAAEALPDPR